MADDLYRRFAWTWVLNGSDTLSHGWKPESGFMQYRWNKNYSETMLLYILAMGSPTLAIGKRGYEKWTSSFDTIKKYDLEYIYAGPLIIHHILHSLDRPDSYAILNPWG